MLTGQRETELQLVHISTPPKKKAHTAPGPKVGGLGHSLIWAFLNIDPPLPLLVLLGAIDVPTQAAPQRRRPGSHIV